ncbi:MAG: BlaI/MecI/CopY family transcriptional regulator [Bacteroidales bacterium]|nr:BlaI/MecI/CopY family transcriptional regulator [Bacteroidales bacterium]
MKNYRPTASELEILQILWKNNPLTVKEINDELNIQKDTGYTTTLKLMQIMHTKGILLREREGKKHLYYPLIQEEETHKALLDQFLDNTFKGSAQKLIMKILGNYETSEEELIEIRKLIDKKKNNS